MLHALLQMWLEVTNKQMVNSCTKNIYEFIKQLYIDFFTKVYKFRKYYTILTVSFLS